ncbi:MAG TPA: LPXTG cell wall anchor domain-containing protein, partial [Anaerolineales bacterium]|nr:LPXTG cell wall anchor domain-containing protein [Anaerolineales bacterium]
ALLTQAALAQTQAAAQLLTQSPTPTPTSTGLPDTGIMDDIGAPTMLGMAGLLILVIFITRRLRAATS